ncbi:MAG: hypothetical protein ABSD96_02125 [Candidatus Korobacteraceae bacterium]
MAIFFVVISFAAVIARQDQRTAADAAQKSAHLNAGTVSAKTDENHPQQNIENSDWNRPCWYVFVTLFRWPNSTAVWVVFLTLMAIAEQTKETAKAAEAALLNAKALIASERPWLVVLPEAVDPEGEEVPHLYRLKVTNEGNTPAQLCGGGIGEGQQSVDPIFAPKDEDLGGFILPLKNLFVHGDYFYLPDIHGKKPEIVGTDTKMFHIYGRIRYWDTFSDRTKVEPYVTQWCFMYRWHDREFHRTADGYNKNT